MTPKAAAPLEPLHVALWLGIGDCHWVCTKLRALSKHHGGRPVHAHVSTSDNHRSIGFLQIVPQVTAAVEDDRAIHNLQKAFPPPDDYKSPRWSTLEGCRGWRGFDYALIANGHLERGEPLATWLPELETEYSYPLRISAADRTYARALAEPGAVLLYLSGTGANAGFHGGTWRTADWVRVVRELNDAGIVPAFVGADSSEDFAYRRLVMQAIGSTAQYVDLVGRTTIPQALALIEDAAVWCGLNSGLGIVSAMRATPTVMLWCDASYPIKGTCSATMHPAMQFSWLNAKQLKSYRTFSYGSPGLTAPAVVSSLLEVMRKREAA